MTKEEDREDNRECQGCGHQNRVWQNLVEHENRVRYRDDYSRQAVIDVDGPQEVALLTLINKSAFIAFVIHLEHVLEELAFAALRA